MTERNVLQMRRGCETFELGWGGLARGHVVSFGRFITGKISEVFISGGKSGEQVEGIARDGAVLVSLALQHGVPLSTIKHALTRDSQDNPQSIIGAVVDQLYELEMTV